LPAICLNSPGDPPESEQVQPKPLLFVDIDGVISLSGCDCNTRPEGAFHDLGGVLHFLSSAAAVHLHALAERDPGRGGQWKLAAIERHAGPSRPLAWIDDAHDACADAVAGDVA
jgi:hypothetical protein